MEKKTLADTVDALPGVGPKRAERLAALGLTTLRDLLCHAPRAYEDRGTVISVAGALERGPGAFVVVRGDVASRNVRRAGRGRSMLRVSVEDPTGRVPVFWFNASFLARGLPVGAHVVLAGRVSEKRAIIQPEVSVVDGVDDPVPERLLGIRPLYTVTEGVSQRLLFDLVGHALGAGDLDDDPLSEEVRRVAELPSFGQAVQWAHRPEDMDQADRGRDRLLFDALLPIEIAMKRRIRDRRERPAPLASSRGGGAEAFADALPFRLTGSQSHALGEIVRDLDGEHPMGRMLVGEVGSGKTAVALGAVEEARSRGLQAAILAPTDLLARQHFRSATELLSGKEDGVALLTGTMPAAAAREARHRIATGEADLAIGTHALLSDETRFDRLGLVVIDEQHRFGVRQREALLPAADTPHTLVMTATPIPRSLALLAFGDSDVSTLDARPGSRGEVTTRCVPAERRGDALGWVRDRIAEGEQAFFVRPRIEGDGRGARELHAELESGVLAGREVGLVHGRLAASERDSVLERFSRGEIGAIVATTVVEVGIDVPGATILWVEGAERFGLAQLHQLRGRIARRGQTGYCWLLQSEDAAEESRKRLEVLVDVDDGMRLAEIDLALRGPGELLGLKQSGRIGLFSGLGSNAPQRVASLAERAWKAADLVLAAEAAPGDPCAKPQPVS